MKNVYTLLVLSTFLFAGLTKAQTTIPNGDFENWTDEYHIPYWDGMNYDGNFLHIHTFSQTTDSHSGIYAAQVETIYDPLFGVIPGFAFTGTIEVDPASLSYTLEMGIAVEGRPYHLKGFYKYNPVNNDTMVIVAGMFKWNEAEQDLDSIGGGIFFTSQTTTGYTSFDLPIQYFTEDDADTMYILLSASADTYHPGSVMKVDDLTLDYSPATIVENDYNIGLKCYPNPAFDFVNLEFEKNIKDVRISFTDMLGMTLINKKIENQKDVRIPVSHLPGGIYVVSVISENRTVAKQKVWIAH
jgi:hypothetical protein